MGLRADGVMAWSSSQAGWEFPCFRKETGTCMCLQAAEVRKCLRKGQEVARLELLVGGIKEGLARFRLLNATVALDGT